MAAVARATPPSRRSEPKAEKRKQCNCRNSRCLKLYCECFASGQYCFAWCVIASASAHRARSLALCCTCGEFLRFRWPLNLAPHL
eukprot:6850012-Prymnesium_polylepis.1